MLNKGLSCQFNDMDCRRNMGTVSEIGLFVEVLGKDHTQFLGAEKLGYIPW